MLENDTLNIVSLVINVLTLIVMGISLNTLLKSECISGNQSIRRRTSVDTI